MFSSDVMIIQLVGNIFSFEVIEILECFNSKTLKARKFSRLLVKQKDKVLSSLIGAAFKKNSTHKRIALINIGGKNPNQKNERTTKSI